MIGSYKLTAQRVPPQMASLLLVQSFTPPEDPLLSCPPSCILRLSNMVTDDDLKDDESYQELKVLLIIFHSFLIPLTLSNMFMIG